jgi:hypothetical protein
VSVVRSALLIGFLGVAAYANSLGNGFAYDDFHIVPQNPVVTESSPVAALGLPYWPRAVEGTGLYRPVTVASFAVEWRAFSGSPIGFHALNIIAHAAVSVLVFVLLLHFLPVAGAFVGGAVFSLHPLHVEAVANVVGRAELYAAIFVLLACLLYVRGRQWTGSRRYLRLLGIGACYAFGLGSKEIAVTLPGVLLLLEVFLSAAEARKGEGPAWTRELPAYLLLGTVLGAYLLTRLLILGTVGGELPSPLFRGMDPLTRVLTSVSVWPQYLRLLFFPMDLAADYAPGVLFPVEGITPDLIVGFSVLVGLAGAAFLCFRKSPLVSLGILWFGITVLPVSNLLFSTGVLLAERTLYLPSVGLAFLVGWAGAAALRMTPSARRKASVAGVVVCLLLLVRTVDRNPTWMSTYTVLNTLAQEHPESYLSIRSRAMGLVRVGETEEAAELYDLAVALAPGNYALLVEAGDFYGRRRVWGKAEPLLRRALQANAVSPEGYRVLASQLILQGRAQEGHRTALEGLARAGSDQELWSLVSESYIAKGDLNAAIRARYAALGADPQSSEDWMRLGDLLEATGDTTGAMDARALSEERGRTEEPAR